MMLLVSVLTAALFGGSVASPSASQSCFDPITGEETNVGGYFKLPVRYGQTLWFASPATWKRFTASARDYQVNATVGPLKGHSGVPSLDGQTFRCPMCGSTQTVTFATPRVQLQHGQNIYFKCWGCVNMFLADPSKVLGVNVSSVHCLDGPPPGPKDIAYCPVTGERVNITISTNFLKFGVNQQIFASSTDAVNELKQRLASYFLGPQDFPRQVGPEGSPDMREETVSDPVDGTAVEITMKTPRIQFRHGQNLYFASYDQLNAFWNSVLQEQSLVV